jgi:hypothetical protein
MKLKTNELTGAALDWAVAKCVGMRVYVGHNHTMTGPEISDAELVDMDVDGNTRYAPSTDWAQGGPIIEREGIDLYHQRQSDLSVAWVATGDSGESEHIAPTPLIATMRCFVASKLGDEVDVPEELL